MQEIFTAFFQMANPKAVLITAHENADPDALCSAFAIAALTQTLYPEVRTAVCLKDVNVVSKKIIDKFNLKILNPDEVQSDGIIIVDANSVEQLGDLQHKINWINPVLVIDHHVPHPKTQKIAQFLIIDNNAVATTELVYDIYQSLNVTPTQETAALLFLGILYDSRHLLLASNKTIHVVNQLLELGVNYSELLSLLSISIDRPERIARLKAAQRLALHEFNGWLVVISHISAYEASACRALIRLGADVALVYGKNKEEIRMSSRASFAVIKQTNLNLAKDIMEKVGPVMHGEGGGHNAAAGCNGKDNLEAGLTLALELLKEKLSEKA